MYSIVQATQEHVTKMLPQVRTADRYEVMASSGRPIEDVLGPAVANADMAWAGMVGDKVACIFGVTGASVLSETGHPWMIGTDLIAQHAKAFLRRNRKMVGVMLARYPYLMNYVDVRNTKAIEWLKWLGFSILPPQPYGIYRMPFHPFEMRADHV
jgi:hypothetical protein